MSTPFQIILVDASASQASCVMFPVLGIVTVIRFGENNAEVMLRVFPFEPQQRLYLIAPVVKMLTGRKSTVRIVGTQANVLHDITPPQY